MTAPSVQLGVLAVADDPAKGGRADIESVTARATAAGHQVVARSSVSRQPAAIADRLARWLDDPEIDVIIVTGVPSTVVGAALDPDKVQAVSGVVDGLQCGSTFVFSISASGAGAVATVMNSRILHLLDAQKPGNLVGRFPRLSGVPTSIKREKTQDGFAPDHRRPATPADRATPVPVRAQPLPPERPSAGDVMTRPVDRMTPFPEGIATTVDKPPGIVTKVGPMPDTPTRVGPPPTADGKSTTTNVGPAPAPRTSSTPPARNRPRTGANVIARKPGGQASADPPTEPLDISQLDEHIAASAGHRHNDITKPVELDDVMPADAVADEDLDEPIDAPAPAPVARPTPPPPARGQTGAVPVRPSTEPPARPAPTGPARSAQMTPAPAAAAQISQPLPVAARQPTPPVPMPVVKRPGGSNPPASTTQTESGPVKTATTSQPLPPGVAAIALPAAPTAPGRGRAPSAPPMDLGAGPPLRSKRDTLFVDRDAGKISPWKLVLSALVGAGIVSAALYFLGGGGDEPRAPVAKAPADAAVIANATPDAAEATAPPVDAMELEEIEFDVPTGPDPKEPKDPKDPKKPKAPKDAGVDEPEPAPTPDAAEETATEPDRDPSIDPANDCDEAGCVLGNYDRECCAKYKPKTTNGFKPAPAGPSDTLDKAAVKAGIAKVKARVTSCGEKTAVKGTVKIAVVVSPAGEVTDASVSESPDAELGSCVATAVKAAKFATTTNGGKFTVPFVF